MGGRRGKQPQHTLNEGTPVGGGRKQPCPRQQLRAQLTLIVPVAIEIELMVPIQDQRGEAPRGTGDGAGMQGVQPLLQGGQLDLPGVSGTGSRQGGQIDADIPLLHPAAHQGGGQSEGLVLSTVEALYQAGEMQIQVADEALPVQTIQGAAHALSSPVAM
ncbi:MAG: hypothetical protein B0D96_10145 [Candidatus Sedimenticola endophacoides]|nr:MAG: hypothetical protein B0D96_10145 [Candidatus Sedimenticola endophacoides]OQX43477.1 MAG: hypothetical protein B0D86_07460 [Candidatus Sedimenticola endophacoides]